MKNAFVWIALSVSCWNAGCLERTVCESGDTRCSNTIIQECKNDAWRNFHDCRLDDMTCAMRSGTATCARFNRDSDIGSQGDAGYGEEGDSDFEPVIQNPCVLSEPTIMENGYQSCDCNFPEECLFGTCYEVFGFSYGYYGNDGAAIDHLMRGLTQVEGQRFYVQSALDLYGIKTELWKYTELGEMKIEVYVYSASGNVKDTCAISFPIAMLRWYDGMRSGNGKVSTTFEKPLHLEDGDIIDIVFNPLGISFSPVYSVYTEDLVENANMIISGMKYDYSVENQAGWDTVVSLFTKAPAERTDSGDNF